MRFLKNKRFEHIQIQHPNYFGGPAPILTHNERVIIPANEFSSSTEYHSVQAVIDH